MHKSRRFRIIITALVILLVCISGNVLFATQKITNHLNQDFKNAQIMMDKEDKSALSIRMEPGSNLMVDKFFDVYKKSFGLSEKNKFNSFQINTDHIGQTHYRFKQYYKGIELANVQYLIHTENGKVKYAHGRIVHGLNLDVEPQLSEQEALQSALNHINAQSYMWEREANERFLKNQLKDKNATYYPKGQLQLSSGIKEKVAENFRLVYRFDIYSEKPMSRYYVYVDANTGEIIHKISRINDADRPGTGMTFYNGMQNITINDAVETNYWHVDSWNAFGGSGESWWMADSSLGDNGGYADAWYQVLDSDSIFISGTNPAFTFYTRYACEAPVPVPPPGYDAWDGMNVRISTDGGNTWTVLMNPTPAYSNNSLYSFGFQHEEGLGIPGWTAQQLDWIQVTFDLSAYAGQSVQFRFAFASDPAASTLTNPEWFGWQIDDIYVFNTADTLFSNQGTNEGFTAHDLTFDNTTLGNFRLRESSRGGGIETYDALNQTDYGLAVDFLDSDTSFTDQNAQAGVSAHWALEATYDFWLSAHGRNSFDNQGAKIMAFVHFDDGWFNATWNGSVLTFGDGTGNNSPLVAVDIVGHEFGHGVDQYTADLIYNAESGALDESFADIYGTSVENFLLGEDADWFIGQGATQLRSMSDPNSFSDPDTYFGQFWADLDGPDNGGVHTNSGVQNYWFYLLSEGGSGENDNGNAYSVSGIGIDDAAQIAYRNHSVYLTPSATYFDAMQGAVDAATDLYGAGSQQVQSVVDAWAAVGLSNDPRIGVDTDTLDFIAEVSTSIDTVQLTLINNGLDTLLINDLQISGTHFDLASTVNFPLELNSYQSASVIDLAFAPTFEGEVIDTLQVMSNDPSKPTFDVILRGKGFVIHAVNEGVIYAVTGANSGGVILTVDQDNGSATTVGATGFNAITGASIKPSNGELYGSIFGSISSDLVRIDAQTGFAITTATIPVPNIRAIAFDLNDDLFAGSFSSGDLYSVDAATGDTTYIGNTGITLFLGLAVNPVSGELWGTGISNAIYKIDKATAQTTLVGNTGFSTTPEIVFDEEGKLFGLTGFAQNEVNNLIRIDTTSGIGTTIGSTGFKTVYGLATKGTVIVSNVDVLVAGLLPVQFKLHQNFPNPFNPSTKIKYDLPRTSKVVLKIYNSLGQEIKTVVNSTQTAGYKTAVWNGENNLGQIVSSGVYIYKLHTDNYTESMKMLFLR